MIPIDIHHEVERIEAEAWAQRHANLDDEFRALTGAQLQRLGEGVLLIASRIDMLALNRALGFGVSQPLDQATLEEIVTRYRDAGSPRFIVQWSEKAQPAHVPEWLLARGFRILPRMAKMYRRVSELPPDSPSALRIEEVGAEHAEVFGAVAAAGNDLPAFMAPGFTSTLDLPGWTHYLVYDGDRPIAASALFVCDGAAWCGFAGTLPSDRGRGAQGALLRHRVRDAARAGCAWMACETTEETAQRPNPSFRNMLRAGFEVVHYRPNYVLAFPTA